MNHQRYKIAYVPFDPDYDYVFIAQRESFDEEESQDEEQEWEPVQQSSWSNASR